MKDKKKKKHLKMAHANRKTYTFSTELHLISPAAIWWFEGAAVHATHKECYLLCVSVHMYTPEDRKRKCMRDDNSLSALLYKSQSR